MPSRPPPRCASFCPSGYAADVAINDVTLTALRKFTCSDSGADFTARIAPLSAEHGGSGTWQIVNGTGPLAELRGKGIWKSERLSGGPDPGSITFRSTWDGVADFDTASPEIAISKPTARKLTRPAGSYALHMTLVSQTRPGRSPISFSSTTRASRSIPSVRRPDRAERQASAPLSASDRSRARGHSASMSTRRILTATTRR